MRVDNDAKMSQLWAAGVKVREIADRLGMNRKTVASRATRLGLPRRTAGHDTRGVSGRSLAELEVEAGKLGAVDIDDADLPNGNVGYIAYINDRPGYACAGKRAALRSAIATQGR